jgi:hypothetical protein
LRSGEPFTERLFSVKPYLHRLQLMGAILVTLSRIFSQLHEAHHPQRRCGAIAAKAKGVRCVTMYDLDVFIRMPKPSATICANAVSRP